MDRCHGKNTRTEVRIVATPALFARYGSMRLPSLTYVEVDPGGPVVIILASGSEVRRFEEFFQNEKILSMTFFGRDVKP